MDFLDSKENFHVCKNQPETETETIFNFQKIDKNDYWEVSQTYNKKSNAALALSRESLKSRLSDFSTVISVEFVASDAILTLTNCKCEKETFCH